MSKNLRPISAVIITHNVAEIIRPCLVALKKVCAEVIVVDSFSDDGTKEICQKEGVKIISHQWLGFYGCQCHGLVGSLGHHWFSVYQNSPAQPSRCYQGRLGR